MEGRTHIASGPARDDRAPTFRPGLRPCSQESPVRRRSRHQWLRSSIRPKASPPASLLLRGRPCATPREPSPGSPRAIPSGHGRPRRNQKRRTWSRRVGRCAPRATRVFTTASNSSPMLVMEHLTHEARKAPSPRRRRSARRPRTVRIAFRPGPGMTATSVSPSSVRSMAPRLRGTSVNRPAG